MKTIRLILFLLLAVASARATTYVSDGAQSGASGVNTLIAGASPGDTITIPAGSFTWGTAGLVTSVNKAITLVGAGVGLTTIVLADTGPTYGNGGVISISADATVGGFRMNGSNSANVTGIICSTTNSWLIDSVDYHGGSAEAYFVLANSYGVIANCTIAAGSTSEVIYSRGPSNSWQTATSFGTANAVVIEDCTFNNTNGYVCDFNSNARGTVRFCTITTNAKVDGHGLASNTPARGVRQMEVYYNNWTATSGFVVNAEFRGGAFLFFKNSTANTEGGWAFVTEYAYQNQWQNFGQPMSSVSVANPTTITTPGRHGYTNGQFASAVNFSATPNFASTYTVTVTGNNTFTIPVNVTAGGVSGAYTTQYMTPKNYPIGDQIGAGADVTINATAVTVGLMVRIATPGTTDFTLMGSPDNNPNTQFVAIAAGIGTGTVTTAPAATDRGYVWGNTRGGVAWARVFKGVAADAITNYGSTFTEATLIQSNREFFADSGFDTNVGMQIGTTAQMNAYTPSVVGYGWWVTDQGSWRQGYPGTSGLRYNWTGAAWVLAYTPLDYPHPRRVTGVPAPANLGRALIFAQNDNPSRPTP